MNSNAAIKQLRKQVKNLQMKTAYTVKRGANGQAQSQAINPSKPSRAARKRKRTKRMTPAKQYAMSLMNPCTVEAAVKIPDSFSGFSISGQIRQYVDLGYATFANAIKVELYSGSTPSSAYAFYRYAVGTATAGDGAFTWGAWVYPGASTQVVDSCSATRIVSGSLCVRSTAGDLYNAGIIAGASFGRNQFVSSVNAPDDISNALRSSRALAREGFFVNFIPQDMHDAEFQSLMNNDPKYLGGYLVSGINTTGTLEVELTCNYEAIPKFSSSARSTSPPTIDLSGYQSILSQLADLAINGSLVFATKKISDYIASSRRNPGRS